MENKLDIKKAREFVKDQWWDLKEFINRKVYKKEEKENSELYETRWVWYHSALVVELFVIILLLWYIAAGD